MTAVAASFLRTERHVTRREGALALGLYVAFTAGLVLAG
jgi:hypothetical protein